MKKKGFTLIELLAVLVILGIIALIAFPLVGDVIGNSRKKAFERSVDGLEHAAEIDYQDDTYKGDRTYKYENDSFTLISVGDTEKNENIAVEGLIKNGVGEVYIDLDGNTSLTVYNDEWCATKASMDKTITVEEKTDSNCIIDDSSDSETSGDSGTTDDLS